MPIRPCEIGVIASSAVRDAENREAAKDAKTDAKKGWKICAKAAKGPRTQMNSGIRFAGGNTKSNRPGHKRKI
jgi:hypothetical protein